MKRFFWIIILPVLIISFCPYDAVSARPAVLLSFPISDEHAVVYDENGNGSPDLSGDTWIFDMDGNNTADLIVRFRQTPTLTAFIYDDTNANSQVDYRIDSTEIRILESHSRVQVISRTGNWTLASGVPDWNLDLQIDSDFAFIAGVPEIPHERSCGNPQLATTAIQLLDKISGSELTNEQSMFQVKYWDINSDGIPDNEWRNVQSAGSFDVFIVNANPTLHYKSLRSFPLLDTVLWMDWSKARIQALRPLISESGNDASYVLRFNHAVTPGSISAAIENPAAYYDLQSNSDCVPNLIVRAVSADHDQTRGNVLAYNQIRYSWAQSDSGIRYRLFLIGQVFTSQINVYPPFSAPHISYADLPSFVMENKWAVASFAEMENPGRISRVNELPENPYYITALSRSLTGWQNIKLPDDYLPVFLSMREEYNFHNYNRLPRLYLSSIDRRLHLVNAQQGIIVFSADTTNALPGFDFSREALENGEKSIQSATYYSDTDGDGYLDTWKYQENDRPVQVLVIRPGAALLAQTNSLRVKRLPVNFNLYTWDAHPPTTPAEWSIYNEQLSMIQEARRMLSDLAGIFSDLPGDELTIPNTSLQSVSINGQSLLAQITTSGFSVVPGATFINVPGGSAQAGEYVLRSKSDGFWLETLSNDQLQITPLQIEIHDPSPSGEIGILSFRIQNPGNLDANAQLKVWDENQSRMGLLQEKEVVIPAGGEISVDLPWSPVWGGAHRLVAQIDYSTRPDGLVFQVRGELDQTVSIPDSSIDVFFLGLAYLPQNIFLLVALILALLGGTWVTVRSLEKSDEPPAQ